MERLFGILLFFAFGFQHAPAQVPHGHANHTGLGIRLQWLPQDRQATLDLKFKAALHQKIL
jgi:hypothetical protein